MKKGDILHTTEGKQVQYLAHNDTHTFACKVNAGVQINDIRSQEIMAFKNESLMTFPQFRQYQIDKLETKKYEIEEKIVKMKSELIEMDTPPDDNIPF